MEWYSENSCKYNFYYILKIKKKCCNNIWFIEKILIKRFLFDRIEKL